MEARFGKRSPILRADLAYKLGFIFLMTRLILSPS